MIQPVSNTKDILLFVEPEKTDPKSFADKIECLHATDAESCIDMVQRVYPVTVLMDFNLLENECLKIIDGLSKIVSGRIVPTILLVHASDLESIGDQLLQSVHDIVFKPINQETLLGRIAFIKNKSRLRQNCRLGGAEREIVRSARKACHELNQPLQYIMGSIQLALLDLSPGDPTYGMMIGFRQQSERMAQITADLMQLIRSIN